MKKNNYDDVICIIPARGGSKGLPKKNLLKIDGEPLISRPIKHAIKPIICLVTSICFSYCHNSLLVIYLFTIFVPETNLEISKYLHLYIDLYALHEKLMNSIFAFYYF